MDFLDKIKAQQKNWIGHSEYAEIQFNSKLKASITISLDEYASVVKDEFENKTIVKKIYVKIALIILL